ncbi:hypothetical protein AJ88_26325 [Mesorhizobium amorphae CCBAU 01583]|nr:hypothetical protein AJ88_26325 [Mesorhizobium amorphae CCBAU 01583]
MEMLVNLPMLVVNLPLVAVGTLADWLRHRAEQKALLKATDELSESPDDMLSDIGISRDDITTYAFRSSASRRRG